MIGGVNGATDRNAAATCADDLSHIAQIDAPYGKGWNIQRRVDSLQEVDSGKLFKTFGAGGKGRTAANLVCA